MNPVAVRIRSAWPYFLLLALTLAFFAGMWGGKVPLMRDMFFDFLPQHLYAREIWRSGHVPLWNTYSGWGKPFAADTGTATFYPLHVFFYVLSAPIAVRFYCVLHLWIGGAGIYSLARHWGMGIAAALLPAITCMFGAWTIGNLEFANNLGAIVWAPWIILVCGRITEGLLEKKGALQPGNVRRVAMLAVVFVIQYLAGYPEYLAYTAAFACTYIALRCAAARNGRVLLKALLAFGVSGLLALLLAAPQFLPGWEFLGQSERSEAINPGLADASVLPRSLAGLLLPFLNGRPGYGGKYWGDSVFEYWLGTAYVGVLPLLLAPIALVWLRGKAGDAASSRKRWLTIFLLGAGLFGLLMAMGRFTPLYEFLYHVVPGFSRFRYPSKFLVLFVFVISMLAGLGFQALLSARTGGPTSPQLRRRFTVWGSLFLGVLLAGYVWSARSPALLAWLSHGTLPASEVPGQLHDYLVGLLFVVAGLIGLGSLIGCPARWPVAFVLLLAFANLFLVSRQIQRWAPADLLPAGPDQILQLTPHRDGYRVHSASAILQQKFYAVDDEGWLRWAREAGVGDSWLPAHVHQTWQGGMKLARYRQLYSTLVSLPEVQRNKLCDLLGVRYVAAGDFNGIVSDVNRPGPIDLAERGIPQPRAWLVAQWQPWREKDDVIERLLALSPEKEALIEPGSVTGPVPPPPMPTNASAGEVFELKDGPNRLEARLRADTPSLLVVNDAWYPGWQALVDGAPRPVYRANFHFRGVFVEPGEHRVEFIFDPPLFRLGLWISALTSLALVSVLVWNNRKYPRQFK